jgi:hypothetical protein
VQPCEEEETLGVMLMFERRLNTMLLTLEHASLFPEGRL